MFGKAFDDISLDDIRALEETRIPEGRRLEYKRDHYGRTDEAKREFAADISAMANSLGGYLLVGVEEENGIASKIVGIKAQDPDGLIRAVSESLRSSIEPPILGIRVRWLEIESGRGVLIVQVDRSWNAPHRVTVARDNRFFLRDENGKHPMAVNELRRAFLFASEIEERIRRFRTDRIHMLIANEGPLAVDNSSPRLILHFIPQAAFTDGIHIPFDSDNFGIPPLGARSYNSMYSIDGLVSYSGQEEQYENVRAFSTLFRNGTAEAVAKIYTAKQGERQSIALAGIEQDVMQGVKNILSVLQRHSVPPPYYLMLSLVGVRGLSAPTNEWWGGLAYPHRSDKVLLPEMTIDETLIKGGPSVFLHPLFDLMWNAFGRSGSPSYDQNGNYIGR